MLSAFTCEPLLTGLGAGGYMLIVGADGDAPVLLDFFIEAPGRGGRAGSRPAGGGGGARSGGGGWEPPGSGEGARSGRAELVPVPVSFGDAVQMFNIGPASVGTYGMPLGVAEASRRFGRIPLRELVRPAAELARRGAPLNRQQAYVVEILGALVTSTAEGAAIFAPEGRLLRAGETIRQPGVADALERLGEEGAEPFYTGEVAHAVVQWLGDRGGLVAAEDLAAYRVIDRKPVRAAYRGRQVLTNPPPSAGGILIAYALGLLDRTPGPVSPAVMIEAMERSQALRTPEFLEQLDDPGFADRLLHGGGRLDPGPEAEDPGCGDRQSGSGSGQSGSGSGQSGSGSGQLGSGSGQLGSGSGRLGSTTHVAVLDRDGMACSVTCSNGASSGVVVPGTGLHLNNMLGEQDLNPLGFHRHPPGRRLPSMMAPTVVLRDGRPELVLGSAGSNRIRSAVLQTIERVIDEGMRAPDAVRAPRLHYEDGVVYAEPGIDLDRIDADRYGRAAFRERNLFFGGVQAVERTADGRLWGGGDPRRGGTAVVVEE